MAPVNYIEHYDSRCYYCTNTTHFKYRLAYILLSVLPLIVAAFCYPLGNRKMMVLVGNDLNTIERIYGMTLVTLPLWLLIFLIGLARQGPPSSNQIMQTFLVAIFWYYRNNIILLCYKYDKTQSN